jgi:CelD/BcsL family acetyltransferase involved in cellulose biosynthesis
VSAVTSAWPSLVSGGPAFDSNVGPFPHAPFLETWFEAFGEGTPLTVGTGSNLLPMVESAGVVSIAGSADVTDYHSPLGNDPGSLALSLKELADQSRSVGLDSLPHESAHALGESLEQIGFSDLLLADEPTLVLTLDSPDYLAQLSKKQRHESRRKRRRFEEELGTPDLVIDRDDQGRLDEFVAMHRLTEGEKGTFMTPAMEDFFGGLFRQPGWEVATLEAGGRPVATFFGYRGPDCYYLYNSAYDPELREVSPGVVALVDLIENLADQGTMRFDFLKGTEAYKYRMGAVERALYRIVLP